MSTPQVVGLDLSLACTGVASSDWTDTIKPHPKLRGYRRLRWIADRAIEFIAAADLVVVEGPSYGSQSGQAGRHERAGLWWHVTYRLWSADVPFAVAPPSTVKLYATGKGNADKAAMILAAARRFAWFDGGEDEADALFLAALGYEHLGTPIVAMPAANRAAVRALAFDPAEDVAA